MFTSEESLLDNPLRNVKNSIWGKKIFITKTVFIISIFLLSSCSNKKQIDYTKIKKSMTYDEVKDIASEPLEITRGANMLEPKLVDYEHNMDKLEKIQLDSIQYIKEFDRWIIPKAIKNIGTLIYVTWIYPGTQSDTAYIVEKNFKTVYDTTYLKILQYFVDGYEVTKKRYEELSNKETYEKYKKSSDYWLFPPKEKGLKIKYNNKTVIKHHDEREANSFIYFSILKKRCIVFDAASGRVAYNDFYPFQVTQINN